MPFVLLARVAAMASVSLTKTLIDAYGGSIALVTPKNGGACFVVELIGSPALHQDH
jgi:K+-sensing histidine kinase KdpD